MNYYTVEIQEYGDWVCIAELIWAIDAEKMAAKYSRRGIKTRVTCWEAF